MSKLQIYKYLLSRSLFYNIIFFVQECIKSKGLQKYMSKVFPLTDWSLEAMRPSLTTIIRRLDKLFAKLHKSVKLYQVKYTITIIKMRLNHIQVLDRER